MDHVITMESLFWVHILRVKRVILGVYWGCIGILENELQTTIRTLYRVKGLGVWGLGFNVPSSMQIWINSMTIS